MTWERAVEETHAVGATEFLLLAVGGLAAWGLFTGWLAGRLGLDRFGWWVVGTALGPLSLPVLLCSTRTRRRPEDSTAAARNRDGPVARRDTGVDRRLANGRPERGG